MRRALNSSRSTKINKITFLSLENNKNNIDLLLLAIKK